MKEMSDARRMVDEDEWRQREGERQGEEIRATLRAAEEDPVLASALAEKAQAPGLTVAALRFLRIQRFTRRRRRGK
jgi:hypothetical protein